MATTEFPNSYKDPLYASLDAQTEQKLGLPSGLLSSIRLNGEKSNNDQVSDAKARTPYQFTPTTRDLILKKYKIDPYLSPETASEAAGLLLKEGLDRNQGNPAAAVAEYHGGTDRSNWGPVNKSYVARVMQGVDDFRASAPPVAAPVAAPWSGPSTYDQIVASMKPSESAMQGVINAYQSGKMSPEDAKAFEEQVNTGKIVLPGAMKLNPTGQAAEGGQFLPKGVSDAYRSNQMPTADKQAVEKLLKQGYRLSGEIPVGKDEGAGPGYVPTTPNDPTFAQQVVGAGETALALGTGMVGAPIGSAYGGVTGLFDPKVTNLQQLSEAAQRGGEALTYAPRTAAGQAQTAAVGDVMQNAVPLMGLAPQMGALSRAAEVAKPTTQAIPAMARNTAGQAMQAVAERVPAPVTAAVDAVRAAPGKVAEMMGRAPEAAPTPGTMGSAGSAAVDVATQRRMAAQELPVPIELTKGQATRDYAQQRFEGEAAKAPEVGAPIRDRIAQQNQQIAQNFDAFLDQTGAQAPDLRSVGVTVDKALRDQMNRDKTEVNVLYAKARNSDEAKAPVNQALPVSIGEGDNALTSTPLQFINDQPSGLPATGLTDAARQYAVKLGIAEMDDSGQLVPKPGATIAQMEQWRAAINDATGFDPAHVRQATILKKLIDGQTDPVAGPLYRDARNARARVAQNFEDRQNIAKILGNKRGTADRQVAFEDVFDHAILKGSLDDVRNLRRVLQRGGEEGQQAWAELQGQTINHLREAAMENIARDQAGNPIASASKLDKAVKSLDTDGKLDFIFGKKGAEQVRLLNDVTNYVKTNTPGAINTSNTASVLATMLDMTLIGGGGVPLPVASGLRLVVNNIKDRRLRMRVEDALGTAEKDRVREQIRKTKAMKSSRTLH